MLRRETLWIIMIGTLLPVTECKVGRNCEFHNLSDGMQYQCPPRNHRMIFRIMPNESIQISCITYNSLTLDFLLDDRYALVNIQERTLKMRNCPLHEVNFKQILDRLNISEIESIALEDLQWNSVKNLPKNLFNGLSTLENLFLKSIVTENNSLKMDFLQNLPNLHFLLLEKNNIREIDCNAFTYSLKLRRLDIQDNLIQHLPDRLFKNLSKLELLYLWKNKLTNLSKETFTGLKQLTFLELSENNIMHLDEDVFSELVELRSISLNSNNLSAISSRIFRHNAFLNEIKIESNPHLNLSDYMFANLTHLNKVYLDDSNLKTLPEHIFEGCYNLLELSLKGNHIDSLSEDMFKHLIQMKKLIHLLENREELLLEDKLTNLKNQLFNDLQKFEYLLSNNRTTNFDESLTITTHLNEINLSDNLIDILNILRSNIITQAQNLETGDLSGNQTRRIEVDKLESVFNNLVKVLLDNNTITKIVFENSKHYLQNEYPQNSDFSTVEVSISQNLISCGCTIYGLIQVKELGPSNVTLECEECPDCFCLYRPYDRYEVIDCSRRNLTKPLALFLITKRSIRSVEVNLTGNALEDVSRSGLGYENITKRDWFISNMKSLILILPDIKELVLNGLHSSIIIRTIDDPCTLQIFCTKKNHTVDEGSQREELPKSNTPIIMTIAVSILAIICIVTVVTALYLYHKEKIKVWLYTNNLCLWFITEEDLDQDKIYDIYMSYSHNDEDFVIKNILPVLEAGPNPFKVCIHVRDWIPGEFITTQITKSVLNSRRTLVVLSENFLESVWGKMEFRTAHTQAIDEGRVRLVVIKYGQLNEAILDEELKMYLKTNTYIEWGDPWFWDKLKYALPHSRQNKLCNSQQKCSNIILEIDAQFERVASSPHIHMESCST